MSEYWVSGKKIWCKFCKTFVYDNKPSRDKHDQSEKHKGAVARHLKKVETESKANKIEQAKVQKELDRINKVLGVKTSTHVNKSTQVKQAIIIPKKKPASTTSTSKEHYTAPLSIKSTTNANKTDTIQQPKANILEGRVGEWQVVEKEEEKIETQIEGTKKEFKEKDSEDLYNFTLKEKEIQEDKVILQDFFNLKQQDEEVKEQVVEPITFKKRKTNMASRNARKKID